MRLVSIKELELGMVVARNLYGPHGVLLLREGYALNNRHISSLIRLGYPGIYIKDEFSKDIKLEEVIDESKRITALTIAKEMFAKSSFAKIEKNTEMFESVSVLIDDMVDQVFQSDSAVLNVPLLKSFDEYTYQHSVDVGLLSIIIGHSLNLSKEMVTELGKCGFLHDMGKMFVPKQILNKPARLTDEEFEVMKKHPELGYDFVKEVLSQSDDICQGVLAHHEKYDGTGYPNKLKGEAIPLFARIISVADVYDAISSKRSYKAAEIAAEAYEFIMGNAGSHFCPDVTRAFCSSVAPFPVGTTVGLSNGKRGVVLENHKDFMMRPLIRMYDPADTSNNEIINLSTDINALDIVIVSKRGD